MRRDFVKKLFIVLSSVCIVTLAGCGESAEPLDEVAVGQYEVYAEFGEYSLLKQKEILDTDLYLMYALNIGPEGDTCQVGNYHERHFIIEYKDAYYSVKEADKLGIYDCQELQESGFLDESHINQDTN